MTLPGKHSAYKASQTPMLPKPLLCGEQPLTHFEQSSREFPVCLYMCLVEPDKGSGKKYRRKIDEERLFNKAIGERIPPVPASGWR